LEQALLIPKGCDFLERALQSELDLLFLKKIGWDQIEHPLSLARLTSSHKGRTLLHLAVLDNRLDIIQLLQSDSALKNRRDAFGLTPLDIARLLNKQEALRLLQPLTEVVGFRDIPALSQFEYLPYPIFETQEGFDEVLSNVAKAKARDQIPPEKIWMGIYFDKEISNALHPPISIRYVDQEVGYGVFSDKKIPPCCYVGEYTGIIQARKPKQLKEKNHCVRYTTWEGRKNYAIDAEQKGNLTRFINHSSKPNLGLQSVYWRGISRMIFVALREIREGGQLTFDYGPLFWKHNAKIPKEFADDF